MKRLLTVDARFLRDVARGLFLVFLAPQYRRHVAFAIFAAVDEGDNVVDVPGVARPDHAAGPMAFSVVLLENANADIIL